MTEFLSTEIEDLSNQLDAAERDAWILVKDLAEERGCQRPNADSWSVAQCLDHLAITNRHYLGALNDAAMRARAAGRLRRRPALPGALGRWFIAKIELPAEKSLKIRAPAKVMPDTSTSLADAFTRFLTSQDEVREFIRTNNDLDLEGIRFKNPFIPGIRFSVATGLHIIAAHERRHLIQAWRARRDAEKAFS